MKSPEEAPDFCLLIGSTPVIAATLGVNQQMENLSLCISFSCILALLIKKKESFYMSFVFIFIFDDDYIDDQEGKVQQSGKGVCVLCFQIFSFFFLFLGVGE